MKRIIVREHGAPGAMKAEDVKTIMKKTGNRLITFRDGQQVCLLGQGTYRMGRRRSEEIRALRRGIDLGLTLIDTAEMYGTEDLVGEAVRGCRDKAFIVSKVLPGNASYEGTKRACERSLRRLGTDYIDLYLLHWIGRYPFAETVRALVELQQEGKIRQWGMSNLDVADMERILALPHGSDCAADQVLYNLKDRGIEYDLIPWSGQHHIPVMAYTPLGEGRLRSHRILTEIARRHNATPTQVMLAWVMRAQNVIAIPKAGSIAHVEENARSIDIYLTEEDLSDIDSTFPAPTHKIHLAGW